MDLINCIRAEAAQAGSVYERIFGLDAQLFHDVVWTALAMFILFFALQKYFLEGVTVGAVKG